MYEQSVQLLLGVQGDRNVIGGRDQRAGLKGRKSRSWTDA